MNQHLYNWSPREEKRKHRAKKKKERKHWQNWSPREKKQKNREKKKKKKENIGKIFNFIKKSTHN